MTITAPEGLEGVVVASTTLSDVDGERGRLIIRGAPVEELAGQVPVEALAAMLWHGLSPLEETASSVATHLGHARVLAFEEMAPAFDAVAGLVPIDALRALLSFAGARGPGAAAAGTCHAPTTRLRAAPIQSTAAHHLASASFAVATAAIGRLRMGQPPVPPDPSASHAHDFLRMLHGVPPSPAHVAALDAYLVTVSDHGMNASTFTARVVASTGAGTLPAIIAALCALQGPLHGGAPGPVLDMLDAIHGEVRRRGTAMRPTIEQWLERELSQGRRLMGFGHRQQRGDREAGGVALRLTAGERRARSYSFSAFP